MTSINTTLQDVPILDLVVDPETQREFSKARVDRMLRDGFDPLLAGALLTGRDPADGRLYLCDGQTRMRAAQSSGYEAIRCLVCEPVDGSTRALWFVKTNRDRRTVDQFDLHRVGVRAGIELDVQVSAILSERHLEAARRSSERGIAGIAGVKKIYERHGGEVLGMALDVVAGAWTPYGGEKWQPDLLQGIAYNIALNLASIDLNRYSEVLRRNDPAIWKAHLHARIAGSGGSHGRPRFAAEMFADEYNKRLHGVKGGIKRLKAPVRTTAARDS